MARALANACLLLAAAPALLASALTTPSTCSDAAALVQVELLIADVSKRSHQQLEPRAANPELAVPPTSAVQLQSLRHGQQSTRIAEAHGTAFDVDLRYDFSAARVPPTDPVKVDKILKTMRAYTATAREFLKTASLVGREINRSQAQSFGEVKQELSSAFGNLCQKANSFEHEFNNSVSANIECMPGPMQEMQAKQTETAMHQMHDFVLPFLRIKEVFSSADNATGLCRIVKKKLVDLQKHSRALVALNRNQAVGSQALLEKMPDAWKPWVNVSLVSEMGSMALQTANSVESATHQVSNSLSLVLNKRLDCDSSGAERLHLHAVLAGLLMLRLLWR